MITILSYDFSEIIFEFVVSNFLNRERICGYKQNHDRKQKLFHKIPFPC